MSRTYLVIYNEGNITVKADELVVDRSSQGTIYALLRIMSDDSKRAVFVADPSQVICIVEVEPTIKSA